MPDHRATPMKINLEALAKNYDKGRSEQLSFNRGMARSVAEFWQKREKGGK